MTLMPMRSLVLAACFLGAVLSSCTVVKKDPLYDEFAQNIDPNPRPSDIVGTWVGMTKVEFGGGVLASHQGSHRTQFFANRTGKGESSTFGRNLGMGAINKASIDLKWSYIGSGKWTTEAADPNIRALTSSIKESYMQITKDKKVLLGYTKSSFPFMTPFTYMTVKAYGVTEREK